jgi:hypothetical protein
MVARGSRCRKEKAKVGVVPRLLLQSEGTQEQKIPRKSECEGAQSAFQ